MSSVIIVDILCPSMHSTHSPGPLLHPVVHSKYKKNARCLKKYTLKESGKGIALKNGITKIWKLFLSST